MSLKLEVAGWCIIYNQELSLNIATIQYISQIPIHSQIGLQETPQETYKNCLYLQSFMSKTVLVIFKYLGLD